LLLRDLEKLGLCTDLSADRGGQHGPALVFFRGAMPRPRPRGARPPPLEAAPASRAVPAAHDAGGRCRPRRDSVRHETARLGAGGLAGPAPGVHTPRSPWRPPPPRHTSGRAPACWAQRRLGRPALVQRSTLGCAAAPVDSQAPLQNGAPPRPRVRRWTPPPPVGAHCAHARGVALRPAFGQVAPRGGARRGAGAPRLRAPARRHRDERASAAPLL
jgi:hypothetical protein